jgi:hypothetical protein
VQTREGNSIDWDSVRRDYEQKPISDRALAREAGVSDTALRKRAKKGGWVKLMDCAPAIEPACKPERNPRPTSLPRPMRPAETGNPSQAARCGAKTRSGAPCKSAPVMSNAQWRRRQWCTEGNQKRQLQARPIHQGGGCHPPVATRGYSHAPRPEEAPRMTTNTTESSTRGRESKYATKRLADRSGRNTAVD